MVKKTNVSKVMNKVVKIVGLIELGRQLDTTYQTVSGWISRNKMSYREYNGESLYSAKIEHITDGEVTIKDILGFVPEPQAIELARLNKKKRK